jgi:hypothetical protein
MNIEFVMASYIYKSNKRRYSNYQTISLLSTAYKFLPNIVLYNVTPYVAENIGIFQCRFRRTFHGGPHVLYLSESGVRIVKF